MCNLYTRSQDEIRRTFGVVRDETGNLPLLPGTFPDQMAPPVREGAWVGFASPNVRCFPQ